MKIAVITCYHDPDYVRARTLRSALKLLPGVRPIIVKNHYRGWLRYPEVIWKLWRVKRRRKPDAYLLTFRGQELLPLVLLLAGKKPVWFDELIVPIAYATGENHTRSFKKTVFYVLARRSEFLYRRWLKRCTAILADTQAHAELSARSSHMNLRKYVVVPVGTDEQLFKPGPAAAAAETFQVFYYSTGMQPLHGMPVVLEAAQLLKDTPAIEFLVVGGKKPLQRAAVAAQAAGAAVWYLPWIPFEQLVTTMKSAGINLAGPFGNTPQARNVVTTKAYQMTASAVPMIIGASPAAAEYFTDKLNALVVPQADAAALARTILWAYEHPAELAVIAENGRKLYEKNFSNAVIARKLQPLIDAAS